MYRITILVVGPMGKSIYLLTIGVWAHGQYIFAPTISVCVKELFSTRLHIDS